jgi:DNA-binding transcriptional LysR family regulator
VELTPMRYFRAIARARHMTRAAEELGVTQPALSAVVKKLEAEVGAALLHRTGRGVEMTDAGRTFLAFAEESLRAAEAGVRAVKRLSGLEVGSIRVGGGATATTYLLPRVVRAVRREHPGLRFYVREGGSSAVAGAVLAGELDLGIVTLPVELPGAGDLLTIKLVEDELVLIVPEAGTNVRRDEGTERSEKQARRSRGGKGGGFRWSELVGVPVVAFEAGTAVRTLVDDAARAAGVTLDVVMELRSIESIKSMVSAGIGVGFVSRFALGEGSAWGQGRGCRDARLTRTLAIVRRRDRVPSAAAGAFERALVGSVKRS